MMSTRSLKWVVSPLIGSLVLCGCGSSAPEHQVKPLTQRAPSLNMYQDLSTEGKIKFIQHSRAPESVKETAIAKLRAGG
jgi:hypothetical protein